MLPIRMTDPYESSTGAQMANLLLNPVGERGNIHVLPLSKGIQKVLKSDGITFRFVSWIACCQETKSVGLRLWACLNPCKPCVESHFVCRLDDDLAWVAQNQTVANGLNCRLYCKPILTGSSISMKLLKPIIWTNHFSINGVNRTFGSKPHSQSKSRNWCVWNYKRGPHPISWHLFFVWKTLSFKLWTMHIMGLWGTQWGLRHAWLMLRWWAILLRLWVFDRCVLDLSWCMICMGLCCKGRNLVTSCTIFRDRNSICFVCFWLKGCLSLEV